MLYHGILAPGRGLETYIKIMNFLPEKYSLKIKEVVLQIILIH